MAAGRPTLPSLLLDGVASPILHVSQLASLLGLEWPAQLEASRIAWDATAILEGWLHAIRPLDFETLTQPTPSRGRSLRNLTVNVFHPFELLPTAFDARWFDWDPALDEAREVELQDSASVVGYATDRYLAWHEWLATHEGQFVDCDPEIDSPRGTLTYANLIASQRFHAAFHYRQVLAVLEEGGRDLTGLLSLASLVDLELPREVF